MMSSMNTKKLALTIVFAALTVALNPTLTGISLAAPYVVGPIYQIWEIPIVIAFLIISPLAGVAISLLNTAVLFAIFPGMIPTGPAYNLAATLSMQAGILAIYFISRKAPRKMPDGLPSRYDKKLIFLATAIGILARIAVMSFILYLAMPQPSPIGYGIPITVVAASLPLYAFFNATLALYTIPTAYFIARTVTKHLKLQDL